MRAREVVAATLALNAALFLVNLYAALVSGSKAVLSQAVYTLTDLVGGVMILWGQYVAEQPATVVHPFGRGKERFFWAFYAGVVTFTLAGVLVLQEGLGQFLDPHALTDLPYAFLSVGATLAVSAGGLAVVMAELRREGRSVDALMASYQQGVKTVFVQDIVGVVGAVVALVGIYLVDRTGMAVFDGLSAAVVVALLVVTGFLLALESRGLLVGRSISLDEGRKILSLVERYPYVRQVLGMQSMLLGPDDVLVTLRVNFMDELTTNDIEMHIDTLRRFVMGSLPHVRHLVITPAAPVTEGARTPAGRRFLRRPGGGRTGPIATGSGESTALVVHPGER